MKSKLSNVGHRCGVTDAQTHACAEQWQKGFKGAPTEVLASSGPQLSQSGPAYEGFNIR